MKALISVLSIVVLVFFAPSIGAQGHEAHHPQQAATQVDTTSGNGMMQGGMMQGGMMQGGMMQGGMMHGGMMQGAMMQGMMGGKGKMGGGMMSGMMGKGGKCTQMMGGGMMQGMMQGMMEMHGPLKASIHIIHHLPGLKNQLNLSDGQVEKLKGFQADFLKRQADWQAALKKKQIDLNMLLDKKPSSSDVRKVLKAIYEVKLDMQVAVYETAQKMLSVLNAEQLETYSSQKGMCMGGMGMMGSNSPRGGNM